MSAWTLEFPAVWKPSWENLTQLNHTCRARKGRTLYLYEMLFLVLMTLFMANTTVVNSRDRANLCPFNQIQKDKHLEFT